MNDDIKLPPYQRLKSIFNEDAPISEKASSNLDDILGIEKKEYKPNIFDRFKTFLKKIDSFIFRKPSKTNNNTPHKRLK